MLQNVAFSLKSRQNHTKNGAGSVDKIVLPVIIDMSILFMKKKNFLFFRGKYALSA